MITYKSRFLTRAEVWFNNEPGIPGWWDWIFYHQCPHPVPGAQTKYFYTFLVDLTQSREQLLANLHKETAHKIRRARDGKKSSVNVAIRVNGRFGDRFEVMYNAFAAMKSLGPLDRPRLESMVAAGVLDLSVAKDPQGNVLVYHANYRDACRATGMESASLYRQLSDSGARNFMRRANRYLTWSDICASRRPG